MREWNPHKKRFSSIRTHSQPSFLVALQRPATYFRRTAFTRYDSRLLRDLGGKIRRGKGDYRSCERSSEQGYETLFEEDKHWSVWVGRGLKLGNDDLKAACPWRSSWYGLHRGRRWALDHVYGARGFWVTHSKDGRNIPGGAEVAEVVDGYDARSEEEGD